MPRSPVFAYLFVSLCLVSPAGAKSSSDYFNLTQAVQVRGVSLNNNTSLGGFTLSSSDPLSFSFSSPQYGGNSTPSGSFLSAGGFFLDFPSPASFNFKRDVFNPFSLTGTKSVTGTGANSPFTMNIPLPDLLATPVTVNTADGLNSYYPVVMFDTTSGLATFKVSPGGRGSTRYTGGITMADPDDASVTDTLAFSGTIGVKTSGGVWGVGDVDSFTLRRGATVVVIGRSASFSPGPIPEPESYSLMVLGVASLGGLLRRRRAPAVTA